MENSKVIINELIILLKNTINKPLFVSFESNLLEINYIEAFINSYGLPAISILDELPFQGVKESKTLLGELITWKKESVNYKTESPIYISSIYEYNDESYDFRHFKLVKVSEEKEYVLLIASSLECIELREHFDAMK